MRISSLHFAEVQRCTAAGAGRAWSVFSLGVTTAAKAEEALMNSWWSWLFLAALTWAKVHGEAAQGSEDLEPQAVLEAGMTKTAVPATSFYPETLLAPANSKPGHWVPEWMEQPTTSYRGAEADLTSTWTNGEGPTLNESSDVLLESVALEKTEAEHREDANEANTDLLEENPSATKRNPVKGVKSLVIGGLLLFLLGWAMSTDVSQYDGELAEESFGDKLVDSWWAVEDYVDDRMPSLPIMQVFKMLLLAAGPVLVVSGLLELMVSLKNRNSKSEHQSTLLLRGLVLMALPTVILALAFVAVPDAHEENFAEAQEDFEIVTKIAWGMHLVGVGMVIARIIKARQSRKLRRDSEGISRGVDELLKSAAASSSLLGADLNEVINSEYAQLGRH
ncbi:hypothetical protein Esti_002055 [Eimeria stiedai]